MDCVILQYIRPVSLDGGLEFYFYPETLALVVYANREVWELPRRSRPQRLPSKIAFFAGVIISIVFNLIILTVHLAFCPVA